MSARDSPGISRTWDGLEIAVDEPIGSSVVVRRLVEPQQVEVLLLHRAHHGPEYAGDWAWTVPAGCRHPGEAVYPGALRELAEEAGLTGLAPWAVDLSSRWALFAVDVPPDAPVDLVDPEHDRYEWLPAPLALARVLPAVVSEQQVRAVGVPAAEVRFRPMTDEDFAAVARWQAAAHVAAWWDQRSQDEDAVRRRYAGAVSGDEAVRMWVVEVDGRPIGMFQDYRLCDEPDYAAMTGYPEGVGFDYLVGDVELVGRGLGTRMIWEFCRDILHRDYPEVAHLVASPSHRNGRSLRALAKCGFTSGPRIRPPPEPGESPDVEIVCTLDVAHWLG